MVPEYKQILVRYQMTNTILEAKLGMENTPSDKDAMDFTPQTQTLAPDRAGL